ncbi:MAG: hypothetical protein JW969_06350 [Spirochaetales bacterium]|nr:hypothetical protein [Spirochaetales bacterium]
MKHGFRILAVVIIGLLLAALLYQLNSPFSVVLLTYCIFLLATDSIIRPLFSFTAKPAFSHLTARAPPLA